MNLSTPPLIRRANRFPSFLTGTYFQTMATFKKPRFFDPVHGPTIFLVPGAFCTSSVMNELGERLSKMGYSVVLPNDFPYFYGPLANLCPLEDSARRLLHFVRQIVHERHLESFWIVAHSNGGLISLLALDLQLEEDFPEFGQMLKGVVTMATPFGGTDVASIFKSVIPVCNDVHPDAEILRRILKYKDQIKCAMKSTADFLVPPESQVPDGTPMVLMEGYNHMDFLVGDPNRISATARIIKEYLESN